MMTWLLSKRWRIIVTSLLIAIFPLVSLVVFVYLSCVGVMVTQANEIRRAIVTSVAQELSDHLENEVTFGLAYASRPQLVEALVRGDHQAIGPHLQNLIATSRSIERVFVASPQGVLLRDYPADPGVAGRDFSAREWYQGVSTAWSPHISEFYRRQATPRRLLFSIAIPIKDGAQVVGILVMQPKADFIRAAVNDVKGQGVRGTVWVVDRRGRLIYHSGRADGEEMVDLSQVPVVAKVMAGASGVEEALDPENGVLVSMAYHRLDQYGWGVVSERPRHEVLAPVEGLIRGVILFSAVMALLAMVMAYCWADMFSASRAVAIRLQGEEVFDKAYTALLTLFNREMSDLTELGAAVLPKLTELCGGHAALLHGCQGQGLTPAFALTVPLPQKAGGVATECLRQGQAIRISEIPAASHLKLSTGIGDLLPREIVATPLFFKGEPMGVLELASLHGFTEGDRRLVERLAPQLGVAINTINNARARRQLTERLASSNEELQAMNLRIIDMNEELQVQTEELGRSNLQLAQVSRAKSDFLANMSHELRTPLNSIIGFSEVLQDQMFGPMNDKQQEYLRFILDGGQHLLALINDILDLAKVESGKTTLELSHFPVRGLLEGALTIVKEKALKHGLDLRLDLAPEAEREIRADQRKLKQVLYNLLSNAVKFTPQGGTITVAARLLPPAGQQGEGLEISVTDTGIGIREEDMARLFQAFSQLESTGDKRSEGTGLGLALSKELVALHGGSIRVESSVGQGSRFVVAIPLQVGAERSCGG